MGAPAGLHVRNHLVKWWKPYSPTYGMVTRTVSPYRQDLFTSWVKKWPETIKHKVTDNIWDAGPPFAFMFFLVTWSNKTFDTEGRKHRD